MFNSKKKEKQKVKDNLRAEALIQKLKETNKLHDIEKIELKNIVKKHGGGVDSVTAEYIGLKGSKNKGSLKAFYILLTLFVLLGVYTFTYAYNSRSQISKLLESANSQTDAYKALEENNKKQSQTINDLNSQVNTLQAQLNQKPTTVYVPQAPSYTAPTYTSCNDSVLGGFYCTSF